MRRCTCDRSAHRRGPRPVDGLIIPGGESSTMLKLLDLEGLFRPLMEFGKKKPIFGTCAGAILLATEVLSPRQASLGLMDLTVERNAYGRQIDSRIAQIDVAGQAGRSRVHPRADHPPGGPQSQGSRRIPGRSGNGRRRKTSGSDFPSRTQLQRLDSSRVRCPGRPITNAQH